MGSRQPVYVIYDGACGFCTRSLRPFRLLDVFGRLRFRDGVDGAAIVRELPALEGADFSGAMYVWVAGEEPYRGFFAFRRMMWVSPWTWLLLPVFYAPFAAAIGTRLYAWVARNRRGLGCRSDVCAAPGSAARHRRP